MRHKKDGYILVEMLISLLAFSYLMFVIVSMLMMLSTMTVDYQMINYELAIKQLKWQIAINHQFKKEDEHYCFDYYLNQRCLKIINNRLILTPGTQIVLTGLDNLILIEYEDALFIQGQLYGKTWRYHIWDLQ
jgi:hypothetical protein